MFDAVHLERNDIPTVTIAHDLFEKAAKAHATALGLPDLPIVCESVPKGFEFAEDPHSVALASIDFVVDSLTESE